jgi:hypothetical protein
VTTLARNSRRADLAAMGTPSPFRAKADSRRAREAQAMINKRVAEVAWLRTLLDQPMPAARRRIAQQRLSATQASLASWVTYLDDGAEREPRAVAKVTR